MDFAFSDEQRMLRDAARSFLEANPEPGWTQMLELGWVGAGMSFVDEAILFEEMGRTLYSGPFFSTVALCAPAIRTDDSLGGSPLTFATTDATGEEVVVEGRSLTGKKELVPCDDSVDDAVVTARGRTGLELWHVRAQVEPVATMDGTRRLGRLALDGVTARPLVESGRAQEVIAEIRLRGLAALAVEAVGVAERVLEMAVAHAKSRRQFGRPIGAFQAVSHQLADSYMDVELARSLAYWAAWCVSESDSQASLAALAAKSFASEAALRSCERSIQVHGGIGFTWEHPLHRYYKRAQWINSFAGTPSLQRAEIAARLLG